MPLGEWVLNRACAEAITWPEHVKVAVNVSAQQFKSGRLVRTVNDALMSSGLEAQRLELEITESALLANTTTTLDTLNALRNLGVRISMDDFGTGFCSLSYLRTFPLDKIKIDRSFIGDSEKDEDTRYIVSDADQLNTSEAPPQTDDPCARLGQSQR